MTKSEKDFTAALDAKIERFGRDIQFLFEMGKFIAETGKLAEYYKWSADKAMEKLNAE